MVGWLAVNTFRGTMLMNVCRVICEGSRCVPGSHICIRPITFAIHQKVELATGYVSVFCSYHSSDCYFKNSGSSSVGKGLCGEPVIPVLKGWKLEEQRFKVIFSSYIPYIRSKASLCSMRPCPKQNKIKPKIITRVTSYHSKNQNVFLLVLSRS